MSPFTNRLRDLETLGWEMKTRDKKQVYFQRSTTDQAEQAFKYYNRRGEFDNDDYILLLVIA